MNEGNDMPILSLPTIFIGFHHRLTTPDDDDCWYHAIHFMEAQKVDMTYLHYVSKNKVTTDPNRSTAEPGRPPRFEYIHICPLSPRTPAHPIQRLHFIPSFMRRKPHRQIPPIKNHKLRLQQHIPINLPRAPLIRLQPAETDRFRAPAAAAARAHVVQQVPRHRGHVRRPQRDAEIRQLRVAGEMHARFLQLRARDLAPVGLDDGVVGQDQGGARVDDGGGGVGVRLRFPFADGEAFGFDLPEPAGGVDGGVGDGALELGRVDFPELVAPDLVVPEVGGEDGQVEAGHDVFEKGLLLLRFDGVDGSEGEADEAVRSGVLQETVRDRRCHFDGLTFHLGTSDVDRVGTDGAAGEGFVTVGDFPACALEWFEGAGFGGIEYGLAECLLFCWETGAEDP